ncbi:MAG TPA: class I SAM-dependent methyltransferase [Anaerolineales bacterium]|nr:class I SAM-dependent methyltransferase [Anaerolineales bacterium]
MSIQKAYDNWSSSYDTDRNLTRDLDREITREALADQHFASILEIGCGTGKNTVFLSQIARRVDALDFSGGMIEKAREKVRADNVRFSIADLTRRWPAEDQSYDLIVCNLVLEHIEDVAFIFSEIFRVLETDGRFLLNELHPFRQYEGKKARYQSKEGTMEIPAVVHNVSDFIKAARNNGLKLVKLDERWHADDHPTSPPRLISFVFKKE